MENQSSDTLGRGFGGFPLPPATPARPLTATINVGSGSADNPTEETPVREMPFDGWLAEVFIRWSDTTGEQVGVQIKYGEHEGGKKLVPYNKEDDFASYTDVNREYPLWLPAHEGDKFGITVQNRDSSSGHTIPMDLLVVKETPLLRELLPPELRPGGGGI